MSSDLSTLSAEIFVIPVGDMYLVYAPLRRAAFVANAAMVNRMADLQSGALTQAANDGDLFELLRTLEMVDAGEEVKPVTHFSGDPKPTGVTFFLTTACNLRCTYCYASAGDTPKRVMSLEVAKRGIDFVIANANELGKDAISIAYHGGGEPTANWHTLVGSYDYAHEKATCAGLDLHAAIATNGVVNDEQIDWITQHINGGASLSFDGLPQVHDAHRLTVLGEGSSHRVIHTIRKFDAAAYPYGLRLTVTREHIPTMEASIRYICENFSPGRIQVEPAYQLGRWKDAPTAETAEFIAGFRASQAIARSFGRRIEFSGARVGLLSNHFCGVTQDSFCLTADGNVSACYETFIKENEWSKTFFYGAYDADRGKYQFDLPLLNHLRNQSVDRHEFCQGCFAKWTCGGDCYHKNLTVNGEGDFKGSDRCHIIRELTKDQLLERIHDAGGLFWHELPPATVHAGGKEMLL